MPHPKMAKKDVEERWLMRKANVLHFVIFQKGLLAVILRRLQGLKSIDLLYMTSAMSPVFCMVDLPKFNILHIFTKVHFDGSDLP